eukprot:437866-Pelagomonas_calceolata.AAC.1
MAEGEIYVTYVNTTDNCCHWQSWGYTRLAVNRFDWRPSVTFCTSLLFWQAWSCTRMWHGYLRNSLSNLHTSCWDVCVPGVGNSLLERRQ